MMEYSSKELPLLDIFKKNVKGQIITDIYYKPTDSQQYLYFKSRHRKNIIKSIQYTIARRIHTIITEKKIKKKARHKEQTQLKTREDTQQH